MALPPNTAPYPSKPYSDYNSGQNFIFGTRDPKKELEYTAALLKNIVDPSGDWATAEKSIGTTLKTRYNDVVTTLAATARTEYQNLLTLVKNDVYGGTPVTPNVAYDQFLAGMSAATGGGHSSVALYSNLATQEKQLMVHESASRLAQSLMGLTYQATSGMPLVVPIESQLVADACASAIEAYSAGEIRAQQIRQSQAAASHLTGAQPYLGNNATPVDQVVMFASLHAQGAAANAT
jgi:hypothetical protein